MLYVKVDCSHLNADAKRLIKVHLCMYSEIVWHPESKELLSKVCELHHGILILKYYCSLLCHEIFSY